MATLVTRSGKGSPLTHAEVDANFTNLNTDKLELSGGTMTGNLSFGDNNKAIFGAGSDLQIYHDASTGNSYIWEQGTGGELWVLGTDIRFANTNFSSNYARFVDGGEVELYYGNQLKFETTSTGVDITGTLTSDGLTVDGALDLNIGTENVGIDITSTDEGSYIVMNDNNATGFYFGARAGSFDLYNTDNQSIIKANATGDISFYEDTGTTPKLVWKSADERLGIGTSSPSSHLHVKSTSDNIVATRVSTNSVDALFQSIESASLAQIGTTGAHAFTFFTSNQERMRIDSSGNVGIGTTTPQSSAGETSLTINGSTTGRLDLRGGGVQAGTISSSGSDMTVQTGYGKPLIIASGTTAYTQFKTNGVERMRITQYGNVGIGTSSPDYPLHVKGTSNILKLETSTNSRTQLGGYDASGNANFLVGSQDSTNTEFWNYKNGYMRFATNSTERMRIDSGGNLLVGKTSAAYGTAGIRIDGRGFTQNTRDGDITAYYNRLTSDGTIVEFAKDGTTVGSIGSYVGNLYIGSPNGTDAFMRFGNSHITPSTSGGSFRDAAIDLGQSGGRFKDLYLSGGIEIENGSGNVGVGKQALNSNTGSNNTAIGYKAGYSGTTASENVIIGTNAGYSITSGSNNTFVGGANPASAYGAGGAITTGSKNTIIGRYDGNQGGLDIRTSSGNIVLSDGDGNPRLQFNSTGELCVGTTSTSSIGFRANFVSATSTGSFETTSTVGQTAGKFIRSGSNGTAISFSRGGSDVGTISITTTATAYNTSSDYRLKENVVELTGATDRLKQLEPKRFNFIANADTTVDGFIAHEVQSVVPEAITGTHNEVDADGNPVYQGIDQSKLVPLLVATIKELEARITALENA